MTEQEDNFNMEEYIQEKEKELEELITVDISDWKQSKQLEHRAKILYIRTVIIFLRNNRRSKFIYQDRPENKELFDEIYKFLRDRGGKWIADELRYKTGFELLENRLGNKGRPLAMLVDTNNFGLLIYEDGSNSINT